MKATLGELLVIEHVISQQQLTQALERQRLHGGRLGTNLLELGFIDEFQLTQFLSKQHNIPPIPPGALDNISPKIIRALPKQMIIDYKVIPFQKDKASLHIAMIDPLDLAAIDAIGFIASSPVKIYITSEIKMAAALEKYCNINPNYRFVQIIRKLENLPTANPSVGITPSVPKILVPEKTKRISVDGFLNPDNLRKIVGEMCNRLTSYCERIVIFFIENNNVAFWDDVPAFNDDKKGELISIDFTDDSFIKSHMKSLDAYIGPIEKNKQNTKLIGALGELYPPDVIILPLTLGKDSFCVVYGDNLLSGTNINNFQDIKRIHLMTLYSIKIYYLKKKIQELSIKG